MVGIHTGDELPFFMQTSAVGGIKGGVCKAANGDVVTGDSFVPHSSCLAADCRHEVLTPHQPKVIERGGYAACRTVDDLCDELALIDGAPDGQPLWALAAKKVREVMEETRLKPPARARPSGKLAGWGVLFEVCTEESSTLGRAASEYDGADMRRITKAME